MNYRRQLDQAIGRRNAVKALLMEAEPLLHSALAEEDAATKALELATAVATKVQSNAVFNLERTVNSALEAVFPGRYQFKVVTEVKRGKTAIRLVLMDEENEVDPMSANGGGLIDVLTFALRVSLLMLGKSSPVLIMDEPFKYVSGDLKEAVYQMMRQMNDTLGVQIIAVTHDKAMMGISDNVVSVAIRGGRSYATDPS